MWVSYTFENVTFLFPHTQYHPVTGIYTPHRLQEKEFQKAVTSKYQSHAVSDLH